MSATLDLDSLLAYLDEDTAKFERFFRENPEAVRVKMDVAHVEDAKGLLHHIFAVEQRYVQRLYGESSTPFEQIPQTSAEQLFQTGREARARLHRFIAENDDQTLNRTITFKTLTSGEKTATMRKVLMHAILHSIRHWAQMTTALRQAGYKVEGQHDFLFTNAME